MKCGGLICGYPGCKRTQQEHSRMMDAATWRLLWLIILAGGVLALMAVFIPEMK